MPYLLELDASHNQITNLLDFAPPKNLKVADFSYNQIDEIPDLSCHHYLTSLSLDSILWQSIETQLLVVIINVQQQNKLLALG